MNNDPGDLEAEIREDEGETAEADGRWDELIGKYEDLARKVHDYLNDGSNAATRGPPIVKPPPSMTKEEWERHQATHTHTVCTGLSTLRRGTSTQTAASEKEET